ncbi:MAG: hypothetical protein IJE18_06190 [Bacteroidaceae bacterium]|nr:hypothetical protein [Bacteroidaceae bacterium]
MREDRDNMLQVWVWLLTAIMVLLMVSCAARTVYVPAYKVHSVTTTMVDTMVEVQIPEERVTNVTTDTTSVIHTSYATSTAEVIDGVLWHRLVQPSRKDSVPAKVQIVQMTDSIPYPVEVEVEKVIIPAWSWWTLAISGISIGGLSMLLIGKIKRA